MPVAELTPNRVPALAGEAVSRTETLVILLFALLPFTDVSFSQIEGKTFHQQNDDQVRNSQQGCVGPALRAARPVRG